MAYIRVLTKRNINGLIKEILYWKMPIGMRIVGVLKKLLSITYWKKKKTRY
jgi:hypothetical protein